MAEAAPGELGELDFARLGYLVDPGHGKRQLVWALVVVRPFSRHSFGWPLVHQTLQAVIEGLEVAWRFFGGVPQQLFDPGSVFQFAQSIPPRFPWRMC